MIRFFRALTRLLIFIFSVIHLVNRYIFYRLFHPANMDVALSYRSQTASFLLKALRISLEVNGTPPQEPSLLVSNHRTYVDPVPVARDTKFFPVVKIQVARWPFIGRAIDETGVIFVDRDSQDSRRNTRTALRDTILVKGFNAFIYPEGTTHKEPHTIAFRKGAFDIAAKENIPVVPIAVAYRDPEDAWVGTDTFIRHFFQCFGKKRIYVKLSYGQAIRSEDAEELLQATKHWIDQSLDRMNAEWEMN